MTRDAVGTVVKDTTEGLASATNTLAKPVEGIAGTAVVYTAIIVGVVGAALYFAGKSGALKLTVPL